MTSGTRLLFFLSAALTSKIAFAGPSSASAVQPPTPIRDTWVNGPYLTGDWGGFRSQLEQEGIQPYAYLTGIFEGNPAGGVSQTGFKYVQDANFGVTLDLQKLVTWPGATFNLCGIDRLGETINPEIGSVYDPMQLYGGQTIFLYNVTLEQKFAGDLGSIKLGRMTPGDDFATSPLYGDYVSNGIDGQIRAVIFDTRFATYPFADWGARLRFDPTPEFNVMTGLFQVSDQMFNPNRHGVNFAINRSDGFIAVQQFGWTPEFDRQPVETSAPTGVPKMQGLPGHYFIGGYWSNSDYKQFGTPVKTRLSYGFYGHADQMVYREAPGHDQGLTIFGTVTYAPQQNIAILPFQLSGGAIYQGLVPDRPDDQTIFGVIYGNFSSDYAHTISALSGEIPTDEIDLEFGYRVQMTKFAYVQPDLQVIVRPGGTGDIPDAVILGAQLGVTF